MRLESIEDLINEIYDDVDVEFYHSDDLEGQQVAVGGFFNGIDSILEDTKPIEVAIYLNEDEHDWDAPVYNDQKQLFDELKLTINHEYRHYYQAKQQLSSAGLSGLMRNVSFDNSKEGYLSTPDEIDAFANVDGVFAVETVGWSGFYEKGNILNDYFSTFGAGHPVFKKFVKKVWKALAEV